MGNDWEHPRLQLKGLVGSPAPRVLSRLPCVPRLFQEGDGVPSGGGARPAAGPGCHVPPPPPPLRREFQSERARGLLLGWNHPAPRRRVGRCHLTARPRPPRVRGGGSVCSVTNGPSRPARPLAPARRGLARARSSRRLPASCCPARRLPAIPPPRRALRAPSAEACPRRSRREAGPRWHAACGPAGDCAVWAWDAAGTVPETCESSDADTGRCGAQVKFCKASPRSLSSSASSRCSRGLGAPAKAPS